MQFEQMGFSIGIPNNDPLPKVKLNHEYMAPKKITKAEMTSWVKKAMLDDDIKQGLLNMLASYPANTMHHFFKNIHTHIATLQAARQSKKND